jgi:hypothetical protein
MGQNLISIIIHSFGLMLDVIMPKKWTRQTKFQVAFGGTFFTLILTFGYPYISELFSFFSLLAETLLVPFIPGFSSSTSGLDMSSLTKSLTSKGGKLASAVSANHVAKFH